MAIALGCEGGGKCLCLRLPRSARNPRLQAGTLHVAGGPFGGSCLCARPTSTALAAALPAESLPSPR